MASHTKASFKQAAVSAMTTCVFLFIWCGFSALHEGEKDYTTQQVVLVQTLYRQKIVLQQTVVTRCKALLLASAGLYVIEMRLQLGNDGSADKGNCQDLQRHKQIWCCCQEREHLSDRMHWHWQCIHVQLCWMRGADAYSLSRFFRNWSAAANTSATWPPAPPIIVPTSVTLTWFAITYSRAGNWSFWTQWMQSTGQDAIASCNAKSPSSIQLPLKIVIKFELHEFLIWLQA